MAEAPIPMSPAGPTRRQVLQTGTIGAASAAFLAACTRARKKGPPKPGQSGDPSSTTLVPPVVPPLAPTPDQLDLDVTVLRTATSLELLAADVYRTYGPHLKDAAWKTAAARFEADHTAAAKVFHDATKAGKKISAPNDYVKANLVDPVAATLASAGDPAILDFLRSIESMLAATYVTAAGTFTTATWREQVMTFGSTSARRVGVLANDGAGAIPSSGLFPVTDLISANAYLDVKPKKKSS